MIGPRNFDFEYSKLQIYPVRHITQNMPYYSHYNARAKEVLYKTISRSGDFNTQHVDPNGNITLHLRLYKDYELIKRLQTIALPQISDLMLYTNCSCRPSGSQIFNSTLSVENLSFKGVYDSKWNIDCYKTGLVTILKQVTNSFLIDNLVLDSESFIEVMRASSHLTTIELRDIKFEGPILSQAILATSSNTEILVLSSSWFSENFFHNRELFNHFFNVLMRLGFDTSLKEIRFSVYRIDYWGDRYRIISGIRSFLGDVEVTFPDSSRC